MAGTEVAVGTVPAVHVDEVIVSLVVVTVPPKAKALPVQVTVSPTVIPEASMSVPRNDEVAARV
ncbi:MAG TPA: hypothetical protein VKU60_13760, partial [Chloroflexota bacterium]|nr:hypothetical protein [Chloroflexota bacterium]